MSMAECQARRDQGLTLLTGAVEKVVFRLLKVHDSAYRHSGGRIGHHLPGMPPSLILHTIGAKSLEPRANTLIYARDADRYLIVASNGGAPRYPSWYHNLRATPTVEINVGARRFTVGADVVLPDDPDYERLWRLVDANFGGRYSEYQSRVSRPIPVVVLQPGTGDGTRPQSQSSAVADISARTPKD